MRDIKNEAFYASKEFDFLMQPIFDAYNESTGQRRELLARHIQRWLTRKSIAETKSKR